MAKYKVLTSYKDKELSRILNVNDVVEMTVKRSKEVNENLKPKNGILERIDNK
ncbi:hypothetical protein LL019_08200 [Staphylococcus pseudintermedius]|uniref:hypothetical protein n=1 Tax=Staphylococcus pseudintermedius TaxID=283734 RepID=UPI001D18EBC0|nr:hypothetical protein [Staphylococcus pseudintermedius]MCC4037893.1 hypothetical protein [Staphylococcus pseudintermedius]